MVGPANKVRKRNWGLANLPLDRQKDVDIVEDHHVLAAFQIGLHQLVFIHGAGQAKGHITRKGQSFTCLCFVLLDEPADIGHIYFEQGVDAVFPPVQIQVVVGLTTRGWKLDNAM